MSALVTAGRSSAERAVQRSPVVSRSRDRQIELTKTVIAAARRLIDTRGDRFTIQELVTEAGVALQTFYRLFATKDDLLLAVLDDMIGEACASLEAAARGLPDPVARVRFYVTQVVQILDREETLVRRPVQHRATLAALPAVPRRDVAGQPALHRSASPGNWSAARTEGLLPETDPPRDAWFITQLVMAVYHHYAFAGSEGGVTTTAEDLWQFCRRALGPSVA